MEHRAGCDICLLCCSLVLLQNGTVKQIASQCAVKEKPRLKKGQVRLASFFKAAVFAG